jgi:hypothetical protein
MTNFQSGAVIDTRPEVEKWHDYKFHELVAAAAPVTWTEKPQSTWRRFPIFNQDGSGSCVAQTRAKELGIMRWLKDGVYVHFSATDIYQRRTNKPASGMGAVDAGNIVRSGVTLEVLVPSQNMSDGAMDEVRIEDYKRQVGAVFAVPNYVEDPTGDIDVVASIIQQTGKGVMVWFYFKIDEWTEKPFIKYPDLNVVTGERHSVCAVDFTLVDGKKYLIIEDSWGTSFGVAGQRLISEEFFKARNWYVGHLMAFKFDLPMQKPSHIFKVDLGIGMASDEVKVLQDCLKFEGVFPNNVDSTGYYGAVTKKAVIAFQARYGIPQIGLVGPITRAKLNELYGG